MNDLERCYKTLGLKSGASLEEINQAYKDLVMVWHPDRVANGEPDRIAEAQEKMKELNHARDRLRDHRFKQERTKTTNASRRHYYQPYPRPHYSSAKSSQSAQPSAQPKERSQTTQKSGSQTESRRYPYRHSNQSDTKPKERSQPTHQSVAQSLPQPDYRSYSRPSESSVGQHYVQYPAYYQAATSQPPRYEATPARSYPDPAPARSAHPDMSGADLKGANLSEKDLSNRNLSHADLSGANLSDAFLHKINLSGANLQQANLFRANLLQANLRQANLRQANLIGADLSGADLTDADLTGAKVGAGDRIMVKLTGAILTGVTLPDGRVHS